MQTDRFRGVVPPMLTPLTPSGAVDTDAVHRLVGYQIDGGVQGIFALGSTGEGAWLPMAQQRALVEATIAACRGRVPVLVGVLEPGTARVIELAQRWIGYSIDALVVTTPYYFQADQPTIEWHFRTIAAASSLPIVAYNIPSMTHNTIAPATMARLLDVENIIGIKDSAGDRAAFDGFLRLRETRPEFLVYQGNERLSAEALLAGASGIVPGLGNIVPQVFAQIYAAALAGDATTARALQDSVDTLWMLHGYGYWLECLKHAGARLGFGSGATIGHRGGLPDEAKAAIDALIAPYISVPSERPGAD